MNSPDTLHAPVVSALNEPCGHVLHLGKKISLPSQAHVGQRFPDCLDFFYIAKGTVLVMHADEEGNERAIFSLGPGSIFNEAPAAAGFDAPNSPFMCQDECQLYQFSHMLLHSAQFVAAQPVLIMNIMSGLAIKLLIIHTSLSNFTGVGTVERLSRFFVSLALRHKSLDFDPAMTQESLAILLGMNRATLVRALRELKDCGAIRRFTKHKLEIGNLELLRKLARN